MTDFIKIFSPGCYRWHETNHIYEVEDHKAFMRIYDYLRENEEEITEEEAKRRGFK